jgi:hypothetical protein
VNDRGSNLQYVDGTLQNDEELVIQAVFKSGYALEIMHLQRSQRKMW